MKINRVCVHAGHGYFHERWAESIQKHGKELVRIDLRREGCLEKVALCDGVMWHLSMKPSQLQSVEPILNPIEFAMNKKVFPNFKSRWHFENKIAQKYLFEAMGIASPKTYCFWEKDEAFEWIESKAKFPIVHKHARGAGSVNISLIQDRRSAIKTVNDSFSPRGVWHRRRYLRVAGRKPIGYILAGLYNMGTQFVDGVLHMLTGKYPHLPNQLWLPEKDHVLFQEFMQNNKYDTRVTIIGNRAFAFRRMNRKNDFRASGGGLLDYDISGIDIDMIKMAFQISDSAGFQSMAYDFLYDIEKRIRICEMSFGYNNRAIYDCMGHWDRQLNWHQGSMWPEEAHVIDFLAN